ncbi:MAG TPA: hypothetical protein VFT74_22045, partial [Isosphaeraceae bacterium]|nr:hypothetical protein [Isosphaeraceae bacterium]
MPAWVIDLIITILILGMTYALTSEGLWGAALTFFNILFSALIALNFYETLAQLIVDNASAVAPYADVICLGGLFLITFILLKVATEQIAPTMVRYPNPVYHLGRLIFGAGASIMAAAFLLLVFHVAPVDRHVFGVIDYEYKPPWGFGLDRKMLAFFQYTTGNTFPRYGSGLGQPGSEYADTYVFDPRGAWLLDHQNARPFPEDGSGKVIEPESTGAPAA